MLKYASAAIMTANLAPEGASRRELRRFAHRHHFRYEVRPGFLYVRSRAISSRCNDNFDEFPAEELEKSYRTFIGKPVFVNHVNDDHRRARGVIIDAALHKDANRDGSKDWWVEVLMEVDAVRFPRLAKEILAGNIARTSMGCDVAYSKCSACGNKATTPAEYCNHIPGSKGMMLYRTTASGQKVGEIIRETCYGLKFFENSLLVEPPADPTAYFLGVDTRGLDKAASKAQGPSDAFLYADEARMPEHVRQEPVRGRTAKRINLPDLGLRAQAARKTAGNGVTYNKAEFPPDAPKNAVGYQPHNGDYKVECERGCTDAKGFGGHWGQHGAAGMLVRHQDQTGTTRYLMQQRSFHMQHGGTWSVPGGGLNANEVGKPHRAAFREMKEEMGRDIPELRVSHIHHDDHGGWGYHTVVADTHHPFAPSRPSREHLGSGWFTEDEIDRMNLHPGFKESWGKVKNSLRENPYHSPYEGPHYASRKHAYGEQKAPEDVDTLREDACPVCGDRDTFDGATCQVCSYVAPPKIFQDPDLEKARQMDLRKDLAEFNDPANPNPGMGPDGQLADPMDPSALDADGNPMDPTAQGPSMQPGGLPGEVRSEVQPGGDPMVDPNALGEGGQIPEELGAPVDPALLGPDGQPIQQPGGQQMLAPDGTPIGPQPLPAGATTDMGQPFTPGPNMPEGPGEPEGPEGPMTPEDLDEDGQPLNPDAGQGTPGTPEDGVADLMCPACGYTADATAPTSVDMDVQTLPNAGSAEMDGTQAGDVCPNCGSAQLVSPAQAQGKTPVPNPV